LIDKEKRYEVAHDFNLRMKLMALALGLLAAISAWKATGFGSRNVSVNPNNAKADAPMPNLRTAGR
jgi:hypothetical protein